MHHVDPAALEKETKQSRSQTQRCTVVVTGRTRLNRECFKCRLVRRLQCRRRRRRRSVAVYTVHCTPPPLAHTHTPANPPTPPSLLTRQYSRLTRAWVGERINTNTCTRSAHRTNRPLSITRGRPANRRCR